MWKSFVFDRHDGSAELAVQDLKPPFVQQRSDLVEKELEVAFQQTHRNGWTNGTQDANPCRVGDGLFFAPLLLLCLSFRIVASCLFCGMVNGAFRMAAHFAKLRLRGNRLGYMRVDLRLVAGRVATGTPLTAVGKQQLVVTCSFGAIDAASGCRHKMPILLVERSVFENQRNNAVDPELKVAELRGESSESAHECVCLIYIANRDNESENTPRLK